MILLMLPAAELLLDMLLYRQYGERFVWWLYGAAIFGLFLLWRAKSTFGAALRGLAAGDRQTMSASLWSLIAGAKAFVAGLLMLFPGVLSDAFALLLLLLPGSVLTPAVAPFGSAAAGPAHDGVIEGEFYEVRDDPARLR